MWSPRRLLPTYESCISKGDIVAFGRPFFNFQQLLGRFQIFDPLRKVVHPHGCLGQLPKGTTSFPKSENYDYEVKISAETYGGNASVLEQYDYGQPANLRALQRNEGTPLSIFPIDDLDTARGNCAAYNEANELLAEAKNCICIGLSEEGIGQSHLNFSPIEKVFYSGDEIAGDEFKNFVALNQYADAIVTSLSE